MSKQTQTTKKAETTQVRNPWRTTVRTAFQATTGLAALVPFVLEAIAQGDPATLGPGAVVALSVSGAVTRVMALPQVEQFLATFLPWLAADPGPTAGPPGLDAVTDEQRESLKLLYLALEEGDPARDAIAVALVAINGGGRDGA